MNSVLQCASSCYVNTLPCFVVTTHAAKNQITKLLPIKWNKLQITEKYVSA